MVCNFKVDFSSLGAVLGMPHVSSIFRALRREWVHAYLRRNLTGCQTMERGCRGQLG